jgi:hypothetical protein
VTSDDDRLLQDLVCGDASEHDPAVARQLAADPRLRARLAALRAAQHEVAELGACPPSLRDEAAGSTSPADRVRVAAALARRPGRARWLAVAGLAAAAILFVLVALDGWRRGPVVDGRLGGAEAVALQREGDRWRVVIHEALPPGTSYHLRLELADGTSSTASAETRTWQFPDSWNESVRRAPPAKLVVEWDDGTGLFVRRVLPLP